MTDKSLKLKAYSPGKFPILAVQMPDGELRLLYHETDYDPEVFKPAEEDWLQDNAIGRHSFVEINPPEEISSSVIKEYVDKEILST